MILLNAPSFIRNYTLHADFKVFTIKEPISHKEPIQKTDNRTSQPHKQNQMELDL